MKRVMALCLGLMLLFAQVGSAAPIEVEDREPKVFLTSGGVDDYGVTYSLNGKTVTVSGYTESEGLPYYIGVDVKFYIQKQRANGTWYDFASSPVFYESGDYISQDWKKTLSAGVYMIRARHRAWSIDDAAAQVWSDIGICFVVQ